MTLPYAKHIPEEFWVDFLEGRANAAKAALIHSHLETGCEECERQQAYWTKFLAALERGRTAAPSAAALQRVFDLFDTLRPRPSVWARIVAHLVADSRHQLIPAGARSGSATSFNLLFEASDIIVSLWCESNGNSWQVTGQVSPPNTFWSVIATRSVAETQADADADVDDHGEFHLMNLAAGQYQLILQGAEQEIQLPDITLQ